MHESSLESKLHLPLFVILARVAAARENDRVDQLHSILLCGSSPELRGLAWNKLEEEVALAESHPPK